MLNNNILKPEVQEFISEHVGSNLQQLALQGSPFVGIQTSELMEQILCKSKCQNKLPLWFKTKRIYFPKKLNIEQTSSEATALYKSGLICGTSLIDLTGGFGVDSLYFSKTIKAVTHCEINETLSEVVKHNVKILEAQNIESVTGDGLDILKRENKHFDWIYLDPSRRDKNKNKRFFISDCSPDVSKHLDLFFKCSQNIMIKLSPMLDIKAALDVLPQTKTVHIVAVKNEVKELLFILEKNTSTEPKLKAINLNSNQPSFQFVRSEEQECEPKYCEPLGYLYEPNAAVLKAGAFKILTKPFDLFKLDQHSHLYTSNKFIDRFPGKVFRIIERLPNQKKEIKKKLSGQKFNVKVRNYSRSVEQIKTTYNISDGGQLFLFCTTALSKKVILKCELVA